MNILTITNLYPPHAIGGYELACADFAHGLANLGHSMHVLTSTYQSEELVPFDSKIMTERTLHFHSNSQHLGRIKNKIQRIQSDYFNLHNYQQTRKTLKRIRPDVAYVWNLYGISLAPILACHKLNIPIVFHLEDYMLSTALAMHTDKDVHWIEKAVRRVLQRHFPHIILNDRFIAVSNFILQSYVTAGMKRSNGVVVHNGLCPTETETCEARQTHALSYMGRIVPEKGLHVAVEALHILQKKGHIINLDIFGNGDPVYIHTLRQRTNDYGLTKQIAFHAEKSRTEIVTEVYPKYSGVLIPSAWDEPFGLVAIEAMDNSCIVIAAKSGALPEIILDNETGFLFEKGNPQHLAQRIQDYIHTENKSHMRKAAKERIRKHFSLEAKVREADKFLNGANETFTPAHL